MEVILLYVKNTMGMFIMILVGLSFQSSDVLKVALIGRSYESVLLILSSVGHRVSVDPLGAANFGEKTEL